jgi:hypothetical protein
VLAVCDVFVSGVEDSKFSIYIRISQLLGDTSGFHPCVCSQYIQDGTLFEEGLNLRWLRSQPGGEPYIIRREY